MMQTVEMGKSFRLLNSVVKKLVFPLVDIQPEMICIRVGVSLGSKIDVYSNPGSVSYRSKRFDFPDSFRNAHS